MDENEISDDVVSFIQKLNSSLLKKKHDQGVQIDDDFLVPEKELKISYVNISKKKNDMAKIAKRSGFTVSECLAMTSVLQNFVADNGPLNCENFSRIVSTCLNVPKGFLFSRVFASLDVSKNLQISNDQLLYGLGRLMRGNMEQKIKFAFSVYTKREKERISDMDAFECLVEALHGDFGRMSVNYVGRMVKHIFDKMDTNGDNMIDLKEFRDVCLKDQSLMECLGPVFPRNSYATVPTLFDCNDAFKRVANNIINLADSIADKANDDLDGPQIDFGPVYRALWKPQSNHRL